MSSIHRQGVYTEMYEHTVSDIQIASMNLSKVTNAISQFSLETCILVLWLIGAENIAKPRLASVQMYKFLPNNHC
jgi:hypothetical protein